LAQTFEEERNKQLYDKDKELHEAQNEIRMVRYQLEEAQRRLELPSSMQLAEARLRIQQLENQSYTGESERNHIELDEPIDDIPGESKTPREKRLEKKVKVLMAQLDASNKINNELKDKLNKTLTHTNEREMQCKRLIAAGCNLPIEKVDSLIEPLTLAIESDPPDLDMTRVIGFMERLKSQPSPNGFRQPASPIYSPHDSTSTPV
jgi:hypothetical protein